MTNTLTVQDEVRAVWSTLLKVTDPPPDVSFFELGGDSLAAHHMLRQLSRTFATDLKLRQIYETPTIGGLAEAIVERLERAGVPGASAGR
ncbi:phosphopantetheine-binding protein [Streptomyces sp. NPDC090022]|uniref:phosphopantetheine-binding protein n=1 Tax=Streptomyces sp. NPDC090022 TaxID=3365920 RepID=UPI0038214CA2